MVKENFQQLQFKTASGIGVRRSVRAVDYSSASKQIAYSLNDQRGVLLASGFEYPGRYTRWDIGFINPPIEITARGLSMSITALNKRGEILLPELFAALADIECVDLDSRSDSRLDLKVVTIDEDFAEENRSRRPSVFTVLRALVAHFRSSEDSYLGLYGAFGYDLTFQFEDVERFQKRNPLQRDLVLYLPDQITVTDHRSESSLTYSYEFNCKTWDSDQRSETTGGFRRTGGKLPYAPAIGVVRHTDHSEGEFAEQVERALEYFRSGDLFEVVPGQMFYEPCTDSPAEVFSRLQKANPAPYGALMNLGEQEYLVAASPEMFVRVDGREIETCPISGTIARGEDAIADARQILNLLNSSKDESELSMCTDVDRNDKARVCVPGSVEVIGRRQIEIYSRLIHTVDHVKGQLREELDALDGLLAHTWAVTVTGAPKLAAMQYLERYEKSPRLWYGGAMGHVGFNGNLNTGLTLRTMRIKEGVAEIRAGATLLFDSDPQAEEAETRLKASALLQAVRGEGSGSENSDQGNIAEHSAKQALSAAAGMRVLMIDHQDSFVHNLAAYFRRCGVQLSTLRPAAARAYMQKNKVDLVILSPGPSRPESFQMSETIEIACSLGVPIFGVCLGLQGIVEYFGGSLATLDYPMHGKPSTVLRTSDEGILAGLPERFTAGRYHSLVADRIPDCLRVSALTEDEKVMAVEHQRLPIGAVQFHPESIMSLDGEIGYRLIQNVVQQFCSRQQSAARNGTA
jgi:anthranilate synthase